MSQDVSTNKRTGEPVTKPPSIQPWSAESEADKLMDELFSDIDHILEGSNKLPTEPVKPEYISLRSIVIPQISKPQVVEPPEEQLQKSITADDQTNTQLVEQSETEVVDTTARSEANRASWPLEKILLVGGLASLVVTIALLLLNQQRLTWPWSPDSTVSPSAQTGSFSDSDPQFISYMLRSLQVIDHKSKLKKQENQSANGNSTTNLASLPAPSNGTPASNQSPRLPERVYIPVYPPQQPSFAPRVAPSIGRLSLPTPLPAARPAVPVRPPAARPTVPVRPPAARPTVPVRSSAARPTVPVRPPAARPTAPARSSAAKPASRPPSPTVKPPTSASSQAAAPRQAPPQPTSRTTSATAPSAPPANHTLVGLLELGNRSAALFDVNGVTQRINVGESIGASGWTLVSVANQEAVIRRNGEVRSVYVGQKF